jgi:spoIIIJ-associated protein
MIKTLEKSGRTEEDALNAALSELGLERDDVSVEIVERAKSGFLGIGAVHAVVRVSYEAPDEPEAKPAAPEVKRTESRPAAPAPAKKPENIPVKAPYRAGERKAACSGDGEQLHLRVCPGHSGLPHRTP